LLTLVTSAAIAIAAALSVPSASLMAATSGAKNSSSRKPSAQTAAAGQQRANNVYIVRMVGEPVASYNGRIKGYAATRPAAGDKIDLSRAETQSYRNYLRSKQDAALAKVCGR
jgi:hypothetical protein